MPRVQAGQRVRLDETQAAAAVGPQVNTARVPAAEEAMARPRQGGRLVAEGARLDQPVVHPLLAELLVRVGIDLPLRLVPQPDVHHADHARLRARAEQADGDLAPRQKLFHEDRLAEPLQETRAGGPKRRAVPDHGGGVHPLAGPLGKRLRKERKGHFHGAHVLNAFDD